MKRALAFLVIWVLCALGGVLATVWMLLAAIAGSKRAWVLAIAFDQLVNAATGGDPDETISSRAARGRDMRLPQWCLLCKLLDAIEDDHCNKSRGV